MNERVLFYRGNILEDAIFDKLTAMSTAELRDLAESLPLPAGNARNLPILPQYLPKSGYVKNTAKYVLGPAGLEKISAPISPDRWIWFQRGSGAGHVSNLRRAGQGDAGLSIQRLSLATEHLKNRCCQPVQVSAANGKHELKYHPIFDKRTGPLVVIATGRISQGEARSLLSAVNYEADVT